MAGFLHAKLFPKLFFPGGLFLLIEGMDRLLQPVVILGQEIGQLLQVEIKIPVPR